MKRNTYQGGFSLIELLVAIVILGILGTAIISHVDTSRSRAQSMLDQMSTLGDANIRLKNDTGCYVNLMKALYDNTAAQNPSNNYCGRTFGNIWNGPYVTRFGTDSQGNAKLDNVSAEATLSFGQEPGGMGMRYFVHADKIPNDIIKQALQTCNTTDDTTASFDQYKCRATLGTGSSPEGSFDRMYDETR